MNVLDCCQQLICRHQAVHKGECGRLAIIAGVSGFFGALHLAGIGALCAGAGVVYGFSSHGARSVLKHSPELIIYESLDPSNNDWHASFKTTLSSHRCHVLAMGPGMGRDSFAKEIMLSGLRLITETPYWGVCDADALIVLDIDDFFSVSSHRLVLTPHVGEFKVLFPSLSALLSDTLDSRQHCVLEASKLCQQVVVLKGYQTVVSDGQQVYVNMTGNSGMATAGSGDVLTGIISACLGQGLSLYEAACCGVYLHGLAGDKAFEKHHIGLVASDIAAYLGEVFQDVERML